MRLFNSQIPKLTGGKTYELSHMVLKKFQGTHYMRTLKDSKITVITDLQIHSKDEELLMKHNLSIAITVQEFTSVKDLQLYYLCPNCNGKIKPGQENLKTIVFLWLNNKENSAVLAEVRVGIKGS